MAAAAPRSGRLLRCLLLGALQPCLCRAIQTLLQGLIQPQGLAIDVEAGKMYWTEVSNRSLSRANLDGSQREVVVPPSKHAEDAPYWVALDTLAGKVYWTTQLAICRANLNGTGKEHLVNATYSGGIALDVEGGKMYWTNWVAGNIWRASLDGSDQEDILFNGLSMPIDLALDTVHRKVYWADVVKKTVERADMDGGTNREALNVSWAIMLTNAIALDSAAERIYLTGSDELAPGGHSAGIYRASLSGADSEGIVSVGQNGMSDPYGIALDERRGAVYWTDRKAGTINRLYLYCQPGSIVVTSRANLTNQDRTTVDDSSVDITVSYGLLSHSGLLTADCPANYSGQVRLACNDGVVSVSSGRCARNCQPGNITQMNGTLLAYEGLTDGQAAEVDCGRDLVGPVHLLCTDGQVAVTGGTCRVPRDCPAGRQQLPESAQIRHGEMRHGSIANASCPDGFNGTYVLECFDGAVYAVSGVCQASCEAGSLWIDDGAGAVEVAHGTIRPDHSLKVVCPDGSAGEGVRLECVGDFIRIASSECIRSLRCDAGSKAIDGVTLGYPGMNEGDVAQAMCPSGYTGSVNFTCRGGAVAVDSGVCAANCEAGTITGATNNGAVSIRHGAAEHGSIALAVCPDGFQGVIPLMCSNGNFSLSCSPSDGCACQQVVTKGNVALPVTALAPLLGALLLCVLAFGVYRRASGSCRKGGSRSPGAPCPVRLLDCSGLRRSTRCTDELVPEGAPPPSETTNEIMVESPIPLPPYWATRDGVHIFPDPNRMNEVQRLMSETWKVCYTRDRRIVGGASRVPVGCRVANVLRIEHHRGYEKYWQHKVGVAVRREGGIVPFPTTTDSRLNLLDPDCNEKYLFHGTNPEAAHAIARNLFRIDMAGSCRGSMFGPGIYLAENASKSDEYAKEGSGVYVGLCAMLVCRAAVGRVFTAEAAGDFSEKIHSGEYDCVCGDRLAAAGTFREMVFFQEEAVYPEFIVIYARIYGDD